MSNIILVGMPACGKSTVGVVLAKTINKGFVDTDILIQETEGKKLQEIINEKGNDYFHHVEENVLNTFQGENCVVATGGSAIYFENAINKMKQNGKVIYLKVSLDTILERLNNIKTRGVTLGEGQTIEDLYNYRIPLYEKNADVIIDAEGLKIEEIIEKIIEKMEI
ncbi:MAG: shikimate kinase [Eubacteriales bacterium]|jgi:shikimate kinase|nr:shikimate kinase [Eubacteriales bacterium]